jgi:hypothetical protein
LLFYEFKGVEKDNKKSREALGLPGKEEVRRSRMDLPALTGSFRV